MVPPDERAALSYVSADGEQAVVFAFQLADGTAEADPVRLGGLHPDRTYEVAPIDLAAPDDRTAQ